MQGLLLCIFFIFLSVGVEAKYHQVPDHLFNQPNFLNARFPNHPFFSNQRKAPINPLFEAAQCKEYYFSEQIIDHFNSAMPPLNSTTYSQRYFVCDGFWDKNSSSPIFFYTGNESDVELYVNNTGLMFELAPEFKALIVFAEHRYFGKSLPFGSSTPKYMNYLTMEQALADYAHFLRWFTETNNIVNPPIITFGGSYGGMLSAWFRMKYPGSVDGAISGSAPVLGFLGLSPPYDQNSFAKVETDDASPAQGASAECATNVRQAFDFIFELSTTPAGLKQLTADLMLCNPLESTDVSILVNWVKSAWDFMTMGDYPYATSYMTNGAGALPPYPTIVACEYLNMTSNDQTTILTAAREAISVFYNVTGQSECYDIKQSVNNATLYEMIYWDYLRCNELLVPYGWTGTSDMFWNETFNLEQQLEICKTTWGVDTDAYKIAETYGGIQAIEAASNIVFSNGVLDPWHPGGVLTNVSSTVVAVLMEGSAHHLDLLWSNPLDPQSVIEGRLLEKANIQMWVNQKLANKKKLQHL